MAAELGATTPIQQYKALIFVENTAVDYVIEEATPWGLRMYLGKPVYGVPWLAPQGAEALCHALRNEGRALVVIDAELGPQAIRPALQRCPGQVTELATWRGNSLKLVTL
jgi:hypothetical protein